MSQNRELKEKIVSELNDKFKKSVTTFFVEYLGSNVKELSELRNDLRENDAEIKVYKNRLVKIAATKSGHDGLMDALLGPNATIFSYGDNVEAIRIVGRHSKENEFLKFKAGIFENKIVDEEFLKTLSKIPSMEVLLTQIGSGLLQFVQQLAYGLTLLDESHLKAGEVKEEKPKEETKVEVSEDKKEVKEEKVEATKEKFADVKVESNEKSEEKIKTSPAVTNEDKQEVSDKVEETKTEDKENDSSKQETKNNESKQSDVEETKELDSKKEDKKEGEEK